MSIGLKYSVNPLLSQLPGMNIPQGYIHTHPTLALFSPDDLDFSVRMYNDFNSGWFPGGVDQPAFVANSGGAVYRWNISDWWSSGGKSWLNPDYYHKVSP